MEIKEKIKARRLELGLTLEEVAEKVGVAKSTVKKWESGQIASMRQTKIIALAKALQVRPTYLIFEDENINLNNGINNGIIGNQNNHNVITLDPKRILNPIDSAILTICESLNEKQKGEVLTFATQLLSKKGE